MTRRVHCIGIGGIGVSALAKYYLSQGARVSGSDAARSEITDELRRRGVKIVIGHRRSNVPRRCDRVVYSAAVGADNPERIEAALRVIPQTSYAEAVGELTRKYFTIAISGSHGKSTTTALIALLLMRAGLDPTVIIGTKLRNFVPSANSESGENFRMGKSNYFVVEADEWNRSFCEYAPNIAVITNIDQEHLDTYKTYNGVVAGFANYLRNVKAGGAIVANWGDTGIRKAVRIASAKNGLRMNVRVMWYNRTRFRRHPLRIPGAHNQLNAEAAWTAAKLLGVQKAVAHKVFRSYRGAWRRLEQLRVSHSRRLIPDAFVYTDYAHHPTEIKATLQALREKHPKSEITAIFQPHQQDRLTRLFSEFRAAFGDADRVILVPIYVVKGRERAASSTNNEYRTNVRIRRKIKTSEDLARAIRGAQYASTLGAAMRCIAADRSDGSDKPNQVIVFMSAGDLDEKIRKLLK